MIIDFYLRFSTRIGQQLFITGNIPALVDGETTEAVPMSFWNKEFWHLSIEIDEKQVTEFHYRYIFKDNDIVIKDAEQSRFISLQKIKTEHITIIDSWNDASFIENAFYTIPFQKVLLPVKNKSKQKKAGRYTHIFKVKAPLLKQNERICLLGNTKELLNWDSKKPLLLEQSDNWWCKKVNIDLNAPVLYKYGIYDVKNNEFVRYEQGENRILSNNDKEGITILHDGFFRYSEIKWKGAGVAIPLFSLRSKSSFGVGEFTDIKLLVDWAAQTGLKLIQLLPVNDTSATFTYKDSYPYSCISAFALHPIYLNLKKVAGEDHEAAIRSLDKKQRQLNSLDDLDYEKVMHFKMGALKELYDLQADKLFGDKDYQHFFNTNEHWLVPYAAYCFLRDKYKTADFNKWKTNSTYNHLEIQKITSPKSKTFRQIGLYYFLQYHLHQQAKEAADYAHKREIVIKGDIPIGISRYSCDAWVQPSLYHMDLQAGAPPDDFAVKGQNWGFPTYNWQRMKEDNFKWWQDRLHQMRYCFNVFRIDHILGFFRIWSIPIHAVEGILGVFVPAIPINYNEFGERGIWFDYNRFCRPYITDSVLQKLFKGHADFVKENFLTLSGNGLYQLHENFDTQKKVYEFFAEQDSNEGNNIIKEGLFDLISNVILFEEPGSQKQQFHFRISVESTLSFQFLDELTKQKLKDFYIDYFYRRQDEFWKKEALQKLPELKEATEMLVCGEDLGMVPATVPEVLNQLGILSLEIQRMPKDPKIEFFHPNNAPYLSVITPSTHDMSTIRGWWEEDREKTRKFFNTVLETPGEAPFFCEAWINRAIVLQHLYSPAMWSIFQIQDILGMSEVLRRQNPHEERINVPADPNHYWRYRMHLTLEQLLKEDEFNKELGDYVKNSGR